MNKAHKQMRGFEYLMYSVFSLCLLCTLILQPLAPVFVYAAEDEVVLESAPAAEKEPSSNSEDETQPENSPDENDSNSEDETQPENLVSESDLNSVQDQVENTESIESTPADTETSDDEEDMLQQDISAADPPQNEALPIISESPSTAASGSTTDEEASAPNQSETAVNATSTNSVQEDTALVVTETPTTTQENEESTVEDKEEKVDLIDLPPRIDVSATSVLSADPQLTNGGNQFLFSKNECVTVGDGTFYCTKADSKPRVFNSDRVFAALDADGDKEIFIERDGELIQISHNLDEDDAPYYDDVSNTLVWHRLINGRYQIVSYAVDSEKETLVTDESYNNMQPNRYGDVTVWQGWVGNDWEIFMHNNGSTTMLTSNDVHDIAPSINGTYIVWQGFEEDAWRMKVYDMRTGHTETISDADGGSIQNPRFVLVYDTKLQSGDIETRGYDLKSGEVVPLSATPAQAPRKLPEPEQDGEKRALVTTPTQPRSKATESEGGEGDGGDDVEDGDIIIPPVVDNATTTDPVDNTAHDFQDSVQNSIGTSTVPEISHIEDLVVTPFIATSTDPQQ